MIPCKKIGPWRTLIQWGFLGWCLFLGIQFALFVRHFETRGATPQYLRPPGVEGFLPIGALVSLKNWLVNSVFDTIHPAALVIFLSILAMSLLAKKSFCSWLCPVGTLSESSWKFGNRVFGRTFRPWGWLDFSLRTLKYLLLAFFAKLILLDMPGFALQGFLKAPYWAVSDVKMLHFFTNLSTTAITVVLLLTVLSLLIKNFWCRYLCPYGALLGLLSVLSPLKIRRSEAHCTHCGNCTRVCPSRLEIHTRKAVWSPECTGCLTCADNCPEAQALAMGPGFGLRPLPRRLFALTVLLIFFTGIAAGMLTGHWESSLGYEDFQRLIPMAQRLGH